MLKGVSTNSGVSGDMTVNGILTATSNVRLANGTVSAPSVAFTSDTGLGIYRPNTNIMAFTSNGVGIMRVNGSGVSISNGTVTFNPSVPLHVLTSASGSNAIFTGGVSGQTNNPLLALTADETAGSINLTASGSTTPTMNFLISGVGTAIGISAARAITFPGIGTTASAANAFLDSGANNNLLRSTSSIKYKRDVQDLTNDQVEAILKLHPITYRSKAEADDPALRWYGFIAEEVADVEPRLVQYGYQDWQFETDENGNRVVVEGAEKVPDGVQYERLTVGLVALVQRQQKQIEEMQAKLNQISK